MRSCCLPQGTGSPPSLGNNMEATEKKGFARVQLDATAVKEKRSPLKQLWRKESMIQKQSNPQHDRLSVQQRRCLGPASSLWRTSEAQALC